MRRSLRKLSDITQAKHVKPGDIVTVNVDRVMIHDIFIPFVADKFEEMGFHETLGSGQSCSDL